MGGGPVCLSIRPSGRSGGWSGKGTSEICLMRVSQHAGRMSAGYFLPQVHPPFPPSSPLPVHSGSSLPCWLYRALPACYIKSKLLKSKPVAAWPTRAGQGRVSGRSAQLTRTGVPCMTPLFRDSFPFTTKLTMNNQEHQPRTPPPFNTLVCLVEMSCQ